MTDNKSIIRRYILFFAVTSVGSNLSSVAIFLNIEPLFQSTQYLGIALAMKTLILALLVGPAVAIIRRFGLFRSLLASQGVGVIFLGVTALGFIQNNFFFVLIGSTLSAVPSVFLGIVTSVNLKMLSRDNDSFRKNQGVIGTAGSSGFLLAAIIVPFLNASRNLPAILFVDGLTYIAGICLLLEMGNEFKCHLNAARDKANSLTPKLSNLQKTRAFVSQPSAKLFVLAASSVLIFKGLTPILSGSRDFGFYIFRSVDMKQFLWSLEAAAGIISGLLYFRIKSRARHLKVLFLLNGVACIPILFSQSIFVLAISIISLSILMSFGYQYFRDSLLIEQKTEDDLDKAAGTASFTFGIVLTISPLLIAAGSRFASLSTVIIGIFALQCLSASLYFGRRNLFAKIETSTGKKLGSLIYLFFSLLFVVSFTSTVLLGAKLYRESQLRQVNAWTDAMPKSVSSDLVEGDFTPIVSKLKLIRETNLFQAFAVFDVNHHLVGSFGETDADPKSESAKPIPILSESGTVVGYYSYQTDLWRNVRPILPTIIVSLAMMLIGFIVVVQILRNRVKDELGLFNEFVDGLQLVSKNAIADIKAEGSAKLSHLPDSTRNTDFKKLEIIVKDLVANIEESNRDAISSKLLIERTKIVQELSKQVAHDIRSPLSALNLFLNTLEDLPREKRSLIQKAIKRINDIANDLLQKSKEVEASTPAATLPLELEFDTETSLIATLVDQIVSEKRIALFNETQIQIDLDLKSSYGLFSKLNPGQFGRVLSNILNNAVESLVNRKGTIVVRVFSNESYVSIVVEDSGRGIPAHILNKIGIESFSFGKEHAIDGSGSGLGLQHAFKLVAAWGGLINVTSEVGTGSRIELKIPKTSAPSWFLSELYLYKDSRVVIVDDDPSIHDVWRNKFLACENGSLIQVDSIFSTSAIKDFQVHANMKFLVDFDLSDPSKNGLDIIRDLNSDAVLVTSHTLDNEFLAFCKEQNVKVLPKEFISILPVSIF